ncbi:hypothetical protein ACVIWV_008650 [Bradyrhizobium diazoefficiens]
MAMNSDRASDSEKYIQDTALTLFDLSLRALGLDRSLVIVADVMRIANGYLDPIEWATTRIYKGVYLHSFDIATLNRSSKEIARIISSEVNSDCWMELTDLRWDQIEFSTATLHVRRVKQGTPSTHPILGDELRALRKLQREQKPKSPFVFTSERGTPFTTAGFARMVERAGVTVELNFKAHPHMLRHACGYALANKGHDTRALQAYLGHKNIQHTVRYTELSPTRFKDFWRD